jgi:adenosine deaminase
MTHEYLRAVEEYGISYKELKRMARNSLEHSFLPGASLWSDTKSFRVVSACAGMKASAACQRFLDGSERAREQWKLEGELVGFERAISTRHSALSN